jgi:HPt (histidine-containing phosphotransfer) domain-containing protein
MIDWDRISELSSELGESDFDEVFALFCDEVGAALDDLSDNPGAQPLEKLHFIKGSALNIGFETVSRLCAEEEARLATDTGATPRITPIRDAFLAARSELGA